MWAVAGLSLLLLLLLMRIQKMVVVAGVVKKLEILRCQQNCYRTDQFSLTGNLSNVFNQSVTLGGIFRLACLISLA